MAERSIPVRGVLPVAFRFDDLGMPDSRVLRRRVGEALADHGVPFTGAVVPSPNRETGGSGAVAGDSLDPLFRSLVRSGGMEPALHGLAHERVGRDRWDRPTEFRGDREDQRERIARGRRLLQDRVGYAPETFVPPWNAYDEGTVAALEELGFTVLSAGTRGVAPARSSLAYLPATTRPSGLEEAAARAAECEPGVGELPLIVVLIHDYDFLESGSRHAEISLEEFGGLLRWVQGHPRLRVLTLERLAHSSEGLTPERYRSLSRVCGSGREALLPPWLRAGVGRGIRFYPPAEELDRRNRALRWRVFGVGLASAGLGAGAALLVSEFARAVPVELGAGPRVGILVITVLTAARAARSGQVYHRGFVALVALSACTVGLWLLT